MTMTISSIDCGKTAADQRASMPIAYRLNEPLYVGSLALSGRAIAAPMAGLSLPAFRRLITEMGCALAYSEMVSCEGVHYSSHKTRIYYDNTSGARPYGVQLFTARPAFLAVAIARIDSDDIDCFDINMGCPVRKVVAKGAGAALMTTPKLAATLIATARRATSKPLTVKLRAGWDESSVNCIEMARIAQSEGADAVILHPRTRAQEFRGRARWELIGDTKLSVRIPVIGNGDVVTADDARRMMGETGCDAVMIGRAAYHNPWIFKELAIGSDPTCHEGVQSTDARRELVLRYLDLLRETNEERTTMYAMRAFLARFVKGARGAARFLKQAHSITDTAALKNTIQEFAFDNQRMYEESRNYMDI